MDFKKVEIMALKYGNKPHYRWESRILEQNKEYVVVGSRPGRTLKHFSREEEFQFNKWAVEFFFFNHWFTTAVVMEDISGPEIDQYYCNIAQPARYENDRISFVDLDLDLIKKKNSSWQVVDKDDFQINQKRYDYPPELVQKTWQALNNLQERIASGEFPFNGAVYEYVDIINCCLAPVSGKN